MGYRFLINFQLFLLVSASLFSGDSFSQNNDVDRLTKNVIDYFLTEPPQQLKQPLDSIRWDKNNGDEIYVELYQRKPPTASVIEKLLNDFKSDSTWTDIDYTDTEASGWQLKTHVDRMLTLTKEYRGKPSVFYQDQHVKKVIHHALGYWFKHMPQNDNWWYNEIGIPKSLGPVLILLQEELSKQEYKDGLKVMNQADFGRTGQNKVWQACNVFYKALLIDDATLARQARDTIVSEIKIADLEGIKADFSFQQHGPQQQFGNYGLAFFTTMASYASIFANTSFELDPDQIGILRNLFDQGFNQLTWKGYFDINSLGRQFFKHTQIQKALALGFAANDLKTVDPEYVGIYEQFINRNFSDHNSNHLTGITNYFLSDMTVYRSKDWYTSIKMSSKRVIGAEAGNKENLKGYYLGDGAYYLQRTGKEYYDIFPLWNWRHLPGITAFESEAPLDVLPWTGYRNNADFVGGIANGMNGVTAFELQRDSLSAKKSYFFINNQLVCLGAGISTSQSDPVVTTLDQSWLQGPVTYASNGLKTLKLESEITNQKVAWVSHNHMTYVPLENTILDISNKTHKGSWHEIIAKYPNESILGDLFTIKVSSEMTPKNGSYAYAILPNFKPETAKPIDLDFEIVRNDDQAQIVKSKENTLFLMVIYQPLKSAFKGLGQLEFKQPGLYQLENRDGEWQITLADPTQQQENVEILFDDKTYLFKMPTGDYKGKSIHEGLGN